MGFFKFVAHKEGIVFEPRRLEPKATDFSDCGRGVNRGCIDKKAVTVL